MSCVFGNEEEKTRARRNMAAFGYHFWKENMRYMGRSFGHQQLRDDVKGREHVEGKSSYALAPHPSVLL